MFTLVFVIAIMISLMSFGFLNIFTDFADGINLIGAAALGVGVFLTLKPQKKNILELKIDDENVNEVSRQSFQKAINDYNYIKKVSSKTKDRQLKQQILIMQETAGNILQYLKQHPEKIPSARRFIDYYQDSAAAMLEKYLELEYTHLNTSEVEDIKQRTKKTLVDIDKAYKEQFNKILNEQIMNMDAELKVMRQTMKAEGFFDGDNESNNENKETDTTGKDDSKYGKQAKTSGDRMKDFVDFTQRYVPDKNKNKFVFYKQCREFCERHGNIMYEDGYPTMKKQILKRKLIAGGLGILFGGLGAHKFYLGKTGWGVFYLVFSWTGIPFIVGFIEGIRYLFMSYDEFLFKYC